MTVKCDREQEDDDEQESILVTLGRCLVHTSSLAALPTNIVRFQLQSASPFALSKRSSLASASVLAEHHQTYRAYSQRLLSFASAWRGTFQIYTAGPGHVTFYSCPQIQKELMKIIPKQNFKNLNLCRVCAQNFGTGCPEESSSWSSESRIKTGCLWCALEETRTA